MDFQGSYSGILLAGLVKPVVRVLVVRPWSQWWQPTQLVPRKGLKSRAACLVRYDACNQTPVTREWQTSTTTTTTIITAAATTRGYTQGREFEGAQQSLCNRPWNFEQPLCSVKSTPHQWSGQGSTSEEEISTSSGFIIIIITIIIIIIIVVVVLFCSSNEEAPNPT